VVLTSNTDAYTVQCKLQADWLSPVNTAVGRDVGLGVAEETGNSCTHTHKHTAELHH